MIKDAIEGKDPSAQNIVFWDELCGTHLAATLGIADNSPASLRKFDDWYFAYYPYLFEHIPFQQMAGRQVLEVGLGYGSVAQRIAEAGAQYHGLDIADGPVLMANHRLRQAGLSGIALRGSILAAPFADNIFDHVVAIGCLHHTGDMQRAIDECWRILRPGGSLIFMVYYAYSYRRCMQAPVQTLFYALQELAGRSGPLTISQTGARAKYDGNSRGEAAPHTDCLSTRSLRYLCRRFANVTSCTENIDNGPPFSFSRPRSELLKTRWPRLLGLDIYATAVK